MFESAAHNHLAWNCLVGGSSLGDTPQTLGMGCILDGRHVLTAQHLWLNNRHRYTWPAVVIDDDIFPCEVAFEESSSDIMVLRTIRKPFSSPQYCEPQYPNFSERQAVPGISVGLIARLLTSSEDSSETILLRHFVSGTVATVLPERASGVPRFAISGVCLQRGSCGTAVFASDGSILGVLVKTLWFPADLDATHGIWYALHIVSSIFPLIQDINPLITHSNHS